MSEASTPPSTREVQELLSVMDQLRSPGGCPWDAEQTHESLIPYALEEAYEVVEAIETGSRADLIEELGDLLLQVVFHARIAEEHESEPFDINDVARGISDKLKRRHPYVFPPAARSSSGSGAGFEGADAADAIVDDVTSVAEQEVTWETTKAAEKQRESVFDGIPLALSPLMRANKILHRARRNGLSHEAGLETAPQSESHPGGEENRGKETPSQIGKDLLNIARRAYEADIDAESALRDAVRELERELRAKEPEKNGPQT